MIGTLTALAALIAPRALWRYRIASRHIDPDEPEAALLPQLTDRRKLSIDVGAAEGKYTALLVPLSERVIAFEPTSQFNQLLCSMFRDTPIVEIRNEALSDRRGLARLRVPDGRPWRSTIEDANTLEGMNAPVRRTTPTLALDSLELRNVGFIKIDVEGHELAVLRGAARTIKRDRPNVLVEVEEQHRPGALKDVFGFFDAYGYAGYFLLDGKLRPIAEFDPARHQDVANLDASGRRRGVYINNFIFRRTKTGTEGGKKSEAGVSS